jgi:centromere-localized protein 2
MPASESEILSNFLLPPAPLHQIITQDEFIALFPRAHQSNPQVKTLYRDFQYQRAVDIDHVKENIAAEVRRGEKQKRRIALSRSKRDWPALDQKAAQDIAMNAEVRLHCPQRHYKDFADEALVTALW